MSSLEACMRKVQGLTKADKDAIRAIRDDILKADTVHHNDRVVPVTGPLANELAVEEYISVVDQEREFIATQVEAVGGVMVDPTHGGGLGSSGGSPCAAASLRRAWRGAPCGWPPARRWGPSA